MGWLLEPSLAALPIPGLKLGHGKLNPRAETVALQKTTGSRGSESLRPWPRTPQRGQPAPLKKPRHLGDWGAGFISWQVGRSLRCGPLKLASTLMLSVFLMFWYSVLLLDRARRQPRIQWVGFLGRIACYLQSFCLTMQYLCYLCKYGIAYKHVPTVNFYSTLFIFFTQTFSSFPLPL